VSRECYRIFDIRSDVNPIPFEVFRSRVHPNDFSALEQNLAQAVSTRSSFSHEYKVVHEDGTVLDVVAIGQFDLGSSGDLELEGIITDVTEQKAAGQALKDAEIELARAARLASIGELAGSIIHEVNQPVTGILASAEACLRWLAREPTELSMARKSAGRIIEQGRRIGKVVDGLRSLLHNGRVEFAVFRIDEAIDEVLLLLKREFERTGITIRTDLDRSAPAVEADRMQLQQVILNLLRNAIVMP
jgi:C4-dicarboxylate-specific signal transduction histidine kinase